MLSLVTGGAGFVGSHLVDQLVRRGDDVVVLDNLSTGLIRNLATAIRTNRVTFVHADVAQPTEKVRGIIRSAIGSKKISEIYHLASPASPDAYGAFPWETLMVNSVGTMSLIDIALEQGARFLYASTSEIYGDPLVHPQHETYFGNVDSIGERACYDEGKRFGEAAVSVACRSRGLDGRLVRFFNCYGPRMSAADGRLIPAFCEAAASKLPLPIHGTGLQTRSMTYISDAITLLLAVMSLTQQMLEPVNIGNDDERTVLQIAETFSHVYGVPFLTSMLSARPGDPQRRKPDLSRARGLMWEPQVSLERGLRETIDWMRETSLEYV